MMGNRGFLGNESRVCKFPMQVETDVAESHRKNGSGKMEKSCKIPAEKKRNFTASGYCSAFSDKMIPSAASFEYHSNDNELSQASASTFGNY